MIMRLVRAASLAFYPITNVMYESVVRALALYTVYRGTENVWLRVALGLSREYILYQMHTLYLMLTSRARSRLPHYLVSLFITQWRSKSYNLIWEVE